MCSTGIEKEYREFLGQFEADPQWIIPVSAKLGDNIANRSESDAVVSAAPRCWMRSVPFKKEMVRSEQPLRFPVQDVYKFDARRIIAGRITAGRLKVGDHLVFSPSNKRANDPDRSKRSIVEPSPSRRRGGAIRRHYAR